MGKVNALIYDFSAGEFSRAGMARIDQARVKLAAETQENIFPYVIGKGLFRPGTGYLGNTASNNQSRLIPFIKSVDTNAVMEFTDSSLRIWVDDALVTRPTVTAPVTNGTLTTPSATITVTIASPAVVTWTGHGFVGGEIINFTTTGALPTGMTAGANVVVLAAGLTTNSFRFAANSGGSAINTSGSQSGTHTGNAGWIPTTTFGATAVITSGLLTLKCPTRGGTAKMRQAVTTASAGVEHGLKIVVERGPVTFRCGSTDGDDDLITETDLDEGEHHLAFTPPGATFWVQFFTRSPIEVRIDSCAIEAAGVVSIPAPWTTAQLRQIRFEQSLDVVYLAHNSWQQQKIERRGDHSWSLVAYKSDDGPFTTDPTSQAYITPSVINGNGTLTSDIPFFNSSHVGALFRLFHGEQNVLASLGAAGQHTDAVEVTGVGATQRTITISISGSWGGSLALQASYDGPTSGFSTSSTIVGSTTSTDSPASDNIKAWYRVAYTASTTGTPTVQISVGSVGGWGIARVVGFNSATSVNIEVLSDFKAATGVGNTPATNVWQEGEWSDDRGWPAAVALFDGRLWWAREDQFWASESDDYTAFNLDTVGDAGSIQRAIATGGSANVTRWLLPLQRLIFGTDGSEASARASSLDQPLTPTNITIKDASTQGSAAITPAKIDGHGIFIQRSGQQVYEIVYALDKQDFGSGHLTKFNDEIAGDGFLEVAVQRQPQSYLWFVREDGQCPILLYDPQEKVNAWVRFIGAPSLAGTAVVESVAVLPGDEQDSVYFTVKRTINGSTVRFIEKLAKHSEAVGAATSKLADAGTFTAGPVSSVTLAHLANETGLVGWGTTAGVSGPITGLSANSSGVITLPATYTNVWVGLPYAWRYKSAKLAYAAQGGTALLQRKKVGPVGLLAADMMYGAITFGPDFTSMDPLPLMKDATNVSQTTVYSTWDEPSFPFPGGWDTDSRLCMKGSAPYPITLLGIVVGVETHETV